MGTWKLRQVLVCIVFFENDIWSCFRCKTPGNGLLDTGRSSVGYSSTVRPNMLRTEAV